MLQGNNAKWLSVIAIGAVVAAGLVYGGVTAEPVSYIV